MSGIINQVGARSGIISGGSSASAGTVTLSGTTGLVYEEGNWTPEFRGTSGSPGTGSVTTGAGQYVRIGNLVTIRVQAGWSNKGTWGGNVFLYGIPFSTSSHGGNYGNSMMVGYVANVSYTDPLKINGSINVDHIKMMEGLGTSLAVSDITTTAYISFTTNYQI
jgi:hypothetical protein